VDVTGTACKSQCRDSEQQVDTVEPPHQDTAHRPHYTPLVIKAAHSNEGRKELPEKFNYLQPESGNVQSKSKSRLVIDFLWKEILWLLRVYLICDWINLNADFGFMTSESYSTTTRAYAFEHVFLLRKHKFKHHTLWNKKYKITLNFIWMQLMKYIIDNWFEEGSISLNP
jgi:hypothetical protein